MVITRQTDSPGRFGEYREHRRELDFAIAVMARSAGKTSRRISETARTQTVVSPTLILGSKMVPIKPDTQPAVIIGTSVDANYVGIQRDTVTQKHALRTHLNVNVDGVLGCCY